MKTLILFQRSLWNISNWRRSKEEDFIERRTKWFFQKKMKFWKKKKKMNDSNIFLKNFPMNKRFSTWFSKLKMYFGWEGIRLQPHKNEKYYKNYFVKKASRCNLSTICSFYGRGSYISDNCPLMSYLVLNHVEFQGRKMITV